MATRRLINYKGNSISLSSASLLLYDLHFIILISTIPASESEESDRTFHFLPTPLMTPSLMIQ